jgi:hypothetical protein
MVRGDFGGDTIYLDYIETTRIFFEKLLGFLPFTEGVLKKTGIFWGGVRGI